MAAVKQAAKAARRWAPRIPSLSSLRGRRWSPPERVAVILVVAIVMGSLFLTSYSLALGDPIPHRIQVALVGDPTGHPATVDALERVARGSLVFQRYPSVPAARHLDLGEYVAVSSDPTPTTVFLEDSAALVGLALALAGLMLHVVTGSAVWDGAASLLIGLLLIGVALVLMRRNGALLIDEAAPADVRERLGQAVSEEPWVAEVAELTAVYVGPRQLLVVAHVVPVEGADLTASVGQLRHRLLAVPAVAAVEITPVQQTS